jgi:hypothetical protein
MRGGVGAVYPALGRWQPPARLLEMSRTRWPRLVRQVWGAEKTQSRTHYLLPDVTLGSAAANYHNMDLPLTVDLPGDADFPRCYFIPDARHDPYGKEKIKEGKGPHSKTLHLRPFWTAAQAYGDALGVVLYRDEEQTKTAKMLESHFVMPRGVDHFWIGDEPVPLRPGAAASFPVRIGQALTFTQGGTVVGVRVLWAAGVGGKPAAVALVDDGNKHGVVRLTVTHCEAAEPPPSVVGAGAALWVHINMINHLEDLPACRRAFAETKAQAQVAAGRLAAKVATGHEPLSVEVGYPDGREPVLNPPPSRAVLEIQGDDLGRKLLAEVEPVKSNLGRPLQAPTVSMQPGTPLYLEAESGHVAFPMVTAEDAAASGGKFVWMPGEAGGQGGGQGGIAWALAVPAAGDYYVWGRVISPTPEDDSFFLDVSTEAGGTRAHLAWHLGTHPQWTWVPYASEGRKEPTAVALPKGPVRFQVLAREDGARIDRLSITDKAGDKPQ